MADTLFVALQTVIRAAWLNPVNNLVYQGKNPAYVVATGSSNAYTITLSDSLLETLAAGQILWWKPNHTNTSAATLTVVGAASLGPTDIYQLGAAVPAGALKIDCIVGVVHDGTRWQVVAGDATTLNSLSDIVTNAITPYQAYDISSEEEVLTTELFRTVTLPSCVILSCYTGLGMTASSSGVITFDMKKMSGVTLGNSIFSTKPTIAVGEYVNTTGSGVAAVLNSDETTITYPQRFKVITDAAGTGATGAKIYLRVRYT